MPDATQTTTTSTGQAARCCVIGAGVLFTFFAGVLLAAALGDYGVGLTRTGWDLARAGAILCGVAAVLAAMTWWAVEQVVQRVGLVADRNRNISLALMHRLDQLDAALTEIVRERGGAVEEAYAQGRVDAIVQRASNNLRVVD